MKNAQATTIVIIVVLVVIAIVGIFLFIGIYNKPSTSGNVVVGNDKTTAEQEEINYFNSNGISYFTPTWDSYGSESNPCSIGNWLIIAPTGIGRKQDTYSYQYFCKIRVDNEPLPNNFMENYNNAEIEGSSNLDLDRYNVFESHTIELCCILGNSPDKPVANEKCVVKTLQPLCNK